MRRTREVKVGEVTATVKELTVAEIRAWLKDLEAADETEEPDLIGLALFEEVSLDDLRKMVSITAEEADNLAPSELRQLIEVAKELNADFFALRGRLLTVGQADLIAR